MFIFKHAKFFSEFFCEAGGGWKFMAAPGSLAILRGRTGAPAEPERREPAVVGARRLPAQAQVLQQFSATGRRTILCHGAMLSIRKQPARKMKAGC
jgi:hypothetical protein